MSEVNIFSTAEADRFAIRIKEDVKTDLNAKIAHVEVSIVKTETKLTRYMITLFITMLSLIGSIIGFGMKILSQLSA